MARGLFLPEYQYHIVKQWEKVATFHDKKEELSYLLMQNVLISNRLASLRSSADVKNELILLLQNIFILANRMEIDINDLFNRTIKEDKENE